MPENDMDKDGKGGSTPVPDPTVLTTEQLNREIASLKDLLFIEIIHRGALTDSQFAGVNQKFQDLSERTSEQKRDTKDALDAALAAQKEAVKEQTLASEKSIVKSETATSERIKGVEGQLQTFGKASDDKIDDLKERVSRIEATAIGAIQANDNIRNKGIDSRAVLASAIGFMLFLIVVAGFVIDLASRK